MKRKKPSRGGGEKSGIESGTRTKGAAAPYHSEQNHQAHGGDGGQAGSKITDAEKAVRSGDQPVHDRRFFQVADAVDVEGDEVVAGKHLAGSFGVRGVHIILQGRRKG